MKPLKYGVVCPDLKPARKSEPTSVGVPNITTNPPVNKEEVPLKQGRALTRDQSVERMYERFGPVFEELAK